MVDALICGGVRTAVGRYGGALRTVPADVLAATVVGALLDRAPLPGDDVDEVIFGQCYPNGEHPAIGRLAALRAGLPISTPGYMVDRRCGSGLLAVCLAAMHVQTGVADVVIAGGVESMSNAEHYTTDVRWGPTRGAVSLVDRLDRGRITVSCESRYPVPGGMLETAENLRREYSISRQEQDEYAHRSHQRAVHAQDAGLFDEQIVGVTVNNAKRAENVVVDRDEHPRPDTSLESLARLTPIRSDVDADATVTAGNASGENDGAAACIIASPAAAERLGLTPKAVLRSWAVAGVDPARMGIGPVPAVATALERAELTLGDMNLVELNEAFAAQVLACTREWKFGRNDFERLNVNGSGISLGHPVGATGARILTDLIPEMHRRDARFALETLCIGGGQGIAAVFERR